MQQHKVKSNTPKITHPRRMKEYESDDCETDESLKVRKEHCVQYQRRSFSQGATKNTTALNHSNPTPYELRGQTETSFRNDKGQSLDFSCDLDSRNVDRLRPSPSVVDHSDNDLPLVPNACQFRPPPSSKLDSPNHQRSLIHPRRALESVTKRSETLLSSTA